MCEQLHQEPRVQVNAMTLRRLIIVQAPVPSANLHTPEGIHIWFMGLQHAFSEAQLSSTQRPAYALHS